MPNPDDVPFDQAAEGASRMIAEGAIIHQKWTCVACGERVTMERPNVFWTMGRHEDCTVDPLRLTDIAAQGCNYLAILGAPHV